jgi:predicted dehydrogenase
MTRIGVLGTGHLGKIHLKLLKGLTADYQLVGFHDPDPAVSAKVSQDFGVPSFASVDELLAQVDAVDIVTPTLSHFELASRAVKQFKHVFIEKPVTATPDEAKRLEELVREAGVRAMVGHVERFNPAMLALGSFPLQPMFIELHRLALWNPRSTDISVVADLMIHDIDIVQHLIKSGVKRVSASGTAVIADTPDIATARIEFHNGAVANLTASRISLKNMRRMRIFQRGAYVTVDFLEKQTEIYHLLDDEALAASGEPATTTWQWHDRTRHLRRETPEVKPVNSIEHELKLFAQAIREGTETAVPLHQAYLALQTAALIEQKLNTTGD